MSRSRSDDHDSHDAPPGGGVASHAAPAVEFNEAVRRALRQWDFRGRGSRSEFWWTAVAVSLANAACGVVSRWRILDVPLSLVVLLGWVILLKAAIRRYHDIGRGALWAVVHGVVIFVSTAAIFIGLVALVAESFGGGSSHRLEYLVRLAEVGVALDIVVAGWALVWLCRRGTPSANRWG